MEKFKVTFLQNALEDLEEIVLYIAMDSKENALKLHNKIIAVANRLSDFPLMGVVLPDRKLKRLGYRRIIVNNYIIFYKVIEDEVVIMRVLHGARDYPELFSNFDVQ